MGFFWACQPAEKAETTTEIIDPATLWGENPWPEIRKKRINQLLPEALKNANVDLWLVLCQENYNDPIATHVGGENASGTAAFLFFNDESGFHSLVFSPEGEATALDDLDIHEKVERVPRGESAVQKAVAFIKEKGFKMVAINTSGSNGMADGTEKTISVEKMAVFTDTGAEYLIAPQEDLILIGKK